MGDHMLDLISRKAAMNRIDEALARVFVDSHGCGETALRGLPSVEAIPVEWIESKIARLKEMDNAFASLTAGQLQALLNDWRNEQNEG